MIASYIGHLCVFVRAQCNALSPPVPNTHRDGQDQCNPISFIVPGQHPVEELFLGRMWSSSAIVYFQTYLVFISTTVDNSHRSDNKWKFVLKEMAHC